MKKTLLILFALVSGMAQAQQIASPSNSFSPAMNYVTKSDGGDMFQANLYSADRIMEMREKLELTDAQASKIKKIHADNAGQFSTLKWDLNEASSKLKKMLQQDKIDQAAVTKQLDEVLKLENQMKKTQLSTLVAIKNELTPDQIKTLGQTQTYVIRGTGSTAPLKIVDGVPMAASVLGSSSTVYATSSSPKVAVSVAGNGKQPVFYIETKSGLKKVTSLETIDPETIESMAVFKGAEAVKKYGAEGENGVIVVTLKNMPE